MARLIFVQEVLTNYRLPFFGDISTLLDHDFQVIADIDPKFSVSDTPLLFKHLVAGRKNIFGLTFFGLKASKTLLVSKNIVHVADFKVFSVWFLSFLSLIGLKHVWLHGQGGYKKSGWFNCLVYNFFVFCSSGYICYNSYSEEKLKAKVFKFLHHKIHHVNNTLYLPPAVVNTRYSSEKIAYVGRIREGSNIELLLQACRELGKVAIIVGASDNAGYLENLQKLYPEATFTGPIYNLSDQQRVLADCALGVYPGDAGLSVVHYMALGLPVLVHDSWDLHMGPEPTYVDPGVNGLTFLRGDLISLKSGIQSLADDPGFRNEKALGALQTFKNLSSPSMANQFISIAKV